MSDLQAVANQLVQAVQTIYDIAKNNEERRVAQQFCDELKESKLSPVYGYYLADKDKFADEVRHVGLGMMENAVRYHWGNYTEEEQISIRENIVNLILGGTHDILLERKFIKEKVASIFVEIAKRTWPSKWPQMDGLLRDMYYRSHTTQEYALMIYRSLAEDVFEYDDPIVELRRKELRAAMICSVASEAALASQYPDGLKKETDDEAVVMRGEAGNEGWLIRWTRGLEALANQWNSDRSRGAELLSITTLNTIAAHLDWVTAKAIAETRIIGLLCTLLSSESHDIRMGAIECLLIVFSRNFPQFEDRSTVIWPVLDEGGLELIFSAYTKIYQANVEPLGSNEYLFMKRVFQTIVALGVNNICFKKNSSLIPKQFKQYISLINALSENQSILLSSMITEFWIVALKHEYISKQEAIIEQFPYLLNLAFRHLHKVETTNDFPNEVTQQYAADDFETQAEFRGFEDGLRTRMVEILKLLVSSKPLDILSWMFEKVSNFLDAPADTANRNPQGMCTARSPYYIQFDAHMTLLESTLGGLPAEVISNPKDESQQTTQMQVVMALNGLLTKLINFQYPDPLIVTRQLPGIVVFGKLMQVDSSCLMGALQKIFTFVTFKMNDENVNNLSESTLQLRRKASTSLVKLGVTIPDVLMKIFSDIMSAVQPLLEGSDLRPPEKNYIFEWLLAIGHHSTSPLEHKKNIFTSVLDPFMQEWCSPEIQNAIASQSAFMEYVGINDYVSAVTKVNGDPSLNPSTPLDRDYAQPSQERRTKILRTVNALSLFLRRTLDSNAKLGSSSPEDQFWFPYLEYILPNLLSLIKCVHGLWNTQHWQAYPQEALSMLEMSQNERILLIGGVPSKRHDTLTPGSLEYATSVYTSWFGNIRQSSYSVLGMLATIENGFYNIPRLNEYLVNSLFESVSHVSTRHWKSLITLVVRPLILHCVPDRLETTFNSFLPSMIQFINDRLQTEWQALYRKGLQLTTPEEAVAFENDLEEGDVSDEMITEKILRDFTRSYVDLWNKIFIPADAHDEGLTARYTILQEYMLKTTVASPLIQALTQLIAFKDTISCLRTVNICLKIIPSIKPLPQLHPLIGGDLLMAALQALHDGYHQEGHSNIISLVVEIYITLRGITTVPYETFAKLPDMNPQKLEAFEASLATTTEPRSQKALMRTFLQNIIGTSKGEWFKKKQNYDPESAPRAAQVVPLSFLKTQRPDDEEIDLGWLFD
ncbi:ARM repeat-containing protein [Basidiobolus meristosporus CBS 931.73]|uniref:ARM repeat-containing protein n=1 Tax=Basidiobolus meristosporus CBS 931.73 TaxID=1314790 RepID=A0A1Y1XSR7_9FUNG|nr:ARM repeat-containing protein [Basidiobolus meristosporus CBS 931.73]|eukprot:ORX88546.1 ARM repeat-containing protein [Basidiobolus meristosporus CBS 931.73]